VGLKGGPLTTWSSLVWAVALAAAFIPAFLGPYPARVGINALKFIVLAISFDILARAGQMSVGHAAFYGIGAYAIAMLCVHRGVPVELGPLVGGLAAAAVAVGLGFLTLRIKGAYFSIGTLAFAEALKVIFLYARRYTFGAQGIGIQPLFGGSVLPSYAYILGLVALSALTVRVLEATGINYALAAIREDEDAAAMLGIDTTKYKVLAFVISAFLAGAAGGFDAGYTTYVYPYEVFSVAISVAAMIMPIFGGLYTLSGPIMGAVSVYFAEEVLRKWIPQGYTIVYGLVLMVSILYLPRGLRGLLEERVLPTLLPRLGLRRGEAEEEDPKA